MARIIGPSDSERARVNRRRVMIMGGVAVASTLLCSGTLVLGTRVPAVPFVEPSCGEGSGMHVLVAYDSSYGSTGEVCQVIGERLCARGFRADVRRVQNAGAPSAYDAVVLGSAVQAGRWLPSALEYLDAHAAALDAKPLAVFCTHMAFTDDSEDSCTRRSAYLDKVRALVAPDYEGFLSGKLGPLALPGRLMLQWVGLPHGDLRDWGKIATWADSLFL